MLCIFLWMRYTYSEEELRKAVRNAKSIAEVCRTLGIKAAGGNYTTLKSKFKLWDIDISHFRGQGWNVGLRFKPNLKKPLNEILVLGSNYQPYKLKRRLIAKGILPKICKCCGRSSWLDRPIPLELHHVNGERTDNRIENLQLLCPNCHALTDNYRGKNIRVAHRETDGVELVKFGERFSGDAGANTEPSPPTGGEGVET